MPEAFTSTTTSPSDTSSELGRDMSYRPLGDSVDSETNVLPPLSCYKKVNAETYTEHFFNISDISYSNEVDIIENFIFNQIEKLNLEDTIDSYEEIINHIIEKLEISKNETLKSKIVKITNYINLLNRNITKEERLAKMHQKKEESDARINKIKSLI